MSSYATKESVVRQIVGAGISCAIFMLSMKMIRDMFDSQFSGKVEIPSNSWLYQALLGLGVKMEDLGLTQHELAICSMAVDPETIDVTWKDIGGLDEEIQALQETVILPIIRRDAINTRRSKLVSFPKGVLLYGPPGCGKTMIAKATAKQSGFILLNIDISVLYDKWVGETPKFVSAIFSTAEKLGKYCPVIIFVDEIDTLLSPRGSGDHETSQQVKSIFMTKWDGLNTSESKFLVIGATNLVDKIDSAVYRRMPLRIHIKLPDQANRHNILKTVLEGEELDSSVDIGQLSVASEGMSGSDLKEYCSQSCMVRFREIFREQVRSCGGNLIEITADDEAEPVRAVSMQDFVTTSSLFGRPSLARFFKDRVEDLFLD